MSATIAHPLPLPSPPSPALSGSSLATLFLTSKKALLHGNNVCNHASTLTRQSNDATVDVLTLDAKLRWLTQAVLDQLKAASSIVKSIESERENLHSVAKEWDRARSQRTRSLDSILEQLGNQTVPPSLHKTVSGSSVFGSPRSNASRELPATSQSVLNGRLALDVSPVDRENNPVSSEDKNKWKTLRDFIDEHSIEDALEKIEEERMQLDDCLARTYDFPQVLASHISDIHGALPPLSSEPVLAIAHRLMTEQDGLVNAMAEDLEGIAKHYGQVRDALEVEEGGVIIALEDLKTLEQDTETLTAVVRDIDSSGQTVESLHHQLASIKGDLVQGLSAHTEIMRRLEDLEETMSAMLSEQQAVQIDVDTLFDTLNSRLTELEHLEGAYVAYRQSYARLLQEMARRDQHRADMDEIVQGMLERLDRHREEEIQRRHEFFRLEGEFIPEDLCPFVTDPPSRWTIANTGEDDGRVIDQGLLEEARRILEGG